MSRRARHTGPVRGHNVALKGRQPHIPERSQANVRIQGKHGALIRSLVSSGILTSKHSTVVILTAIFILGILLLIFLVGLILLVLESASFGHVAQ